MLQYLDNLEWMNALSPHAVHFHTVRGHSQPLHCPAATLPQHLDNVAELTFTQTATLWSSSLQQRVKPMIVYLLLSSDPLPSRS